VRAGLLFFQTGNEAMIGGWVSSYVGHAGWTPRAATAVLAGYWVAVVVGRWIAGRLHGFVPGRWLLVTAGAGSAVGVGWLMAARSFEALAAAVLTTSLALSWVYPTALAIAGDRYRMMAGTVFGALFTLGAVGGMAMPPILGRVSEASGLRVGMTVPLAGAVVVTLLAVLVGFRSTRTSR
jgi:fucose permease